MSRTGRRSVLNPQKHENKGEGFSHCQDCPTDFVHKTVAEEEEIEYVKLNTGLDRQ